MGWAGETARLSAGFDQQLVDGSGDYPFPRRCLLTDRGGARWLIANGCCGNGVSVVLSLKGAAPIATGRHGRALACGALNTPNRASLWR